MIRRLRRWLAELRLDRLDAELARWLVWDGALSDCPLDAKIITPWRREMRARRAAAVEALERAGGHDPHNAFMREPTEGQRAAFGEPWRR